MKEVKFAINLKNVLAAENKTQQQLAEYIGTTQQTVSRWISGKNEPDLDTLLKICKYLNETPNSILGFED